MNCEEFERALEDWEDYSTPPAPIDAHRRGCSACSALVEDLNFIRTQARQLLPMEEPPDRVWEQIQWQVRQEKLVAEPLRKRWFAGAGWVGRLTSSVAYGAAFATALGAVYVYTLLSPRVAPPLPTPVAAVMPAAPNPPIAQVIEKVPPEKRATYVANLNQVESSIQHLQTYLADHPEDPFARDELKNVYQQKSRLWEDLVRWEEF